ncbi:2OG-Fe(II) oxygenase [Thalassotalea sp. LPB0316]|uniref:2OG-Fe(II) oxygenase n=1 Tax=Thalassotalea sp. LPB0316 TaxID=2769490 RepID=UPI0018684A69|nr:2OG-Fe(II) oxygenase [Thalassotalea sp. LPB0316]QOL24507.1 2OG-Fe(II) oxygenase [Thalassotalea sp. LPB0316]
MLIKKNQIGTMVPPIKWHEQLSDKGFAVIDNFLPEVSANALRNNILKQRHHRAWCLLTTPYRPLASIKDDINKPYIDKLRHKQAAVAYRRKQFSFSFYRSANKHQKSHDNQKIMAPFLTQLKQRARAELGVSGELTDAFFASFVKGQFISYHTDGKAGQFAFIYQLSKGWQRKNGGQLVLYPKQGSRFYQKIIEPRFNTLVLLKLDHPMPHKVIPLNTKSYQHRITISGWLK